MKTIDYSYFIERYNACEMDEKEKIWFEMELEDNSSLQADLELRRRTDAILKDQDIISLRNKLAAIEKSRNDSKKVPVGTKKSGSALKYAAAFAGLILIGGLLLTTITRHNQGDGYGSFFNQYEAKAGIRSEISSSDRSDNGMIHYGNNNFEAAKLEWNSKIAADPTDNESVFYRGEANRLLGNYPEAIRDFEAAMNQESFYSDDAQWQLTDCYLKTNQVEKAIANLEGIVSSDSNHRKQARKLLREIQRNQKN